MPHALVSDWVSERNQRIGNVKHDGYIAILLHPLHIRTYTIASPAAAGIIEKQLRKGF